MGKERDIELKNIIKELEWHERLLNAVNHATSILYMADEESFVAALTESMEILTKCIDVDFAFIWQNEVIGGELHYVLRYSWLSNLGAEKKAVGINESFSYSITSPDWLDIFNRDDVINSTVADMSKEDQNLLEQYGVLSVLLIPIFIENEFWGFISFNDCHNGIVFNDEEVKILRTASISIVNALHRFEQSMRLHEALKQARAASNAKSEFLSTMSHEMRTPMNTIIGMASIGRDSADMGRKDYAFTKISDASVHLLGVINNVLDMSKIEANKLELASVEFSFEKMLQKVFSIVHYRMDAKRQNFSVHVDNKVPHYIISDDQRLAEVITNLLSNAAKFTREEGNIELDAFLVEEKDGICEIRIEVTDDGIGIAEDEFDKVFKPFEQAQSGTNREFGGTGLGLVIAKRVVELMGGRIWLESELGKGAKFIFTIKVPRGKRNMRSLLSPDINWETMRILIVDDDEYVRNYFSNLFSILNIKCDSANDGIDACRMIDENGEYNIYFVDWKMPGMNGIELTKKIKEDVVDGQSVVVMISSIDWNDIKNDALLAGVDKYLLKPLFSSSIIDCVTECLHINAHQMDKELSKAYRGIFSGKRILLAEDIEINREILKTLLNDTGIEIEDAENGRIAVEMVKKMPERYDLVFMDVQMPLMDGLEATRRIRDLHLERVKELPIIAMTANVFNEDIAKCLNAGMNGHLGKPLDMDEVMSSMRKYLL